MEGCSVARMMSLWSLAIHPRNLCSLAFRVLPKLLLKKFLKEERSEMAMGELPELLEEVLMDIFALLEIPDLLRASAVCSSWRSAYSSLCNLGQYKLPQTPCLLYTSESAGDSIACLYSLAEKRSYKLTLPEPPIRSRYLIGSSHGWLVTADERSEMHLVNPITCEQIALPSVITIEQVTPIFDETGAICKYHYSRHTADRCTDPCLTLAPDKLRAYLLRKAFVFYDISAGGYIVVLNHNPYGQLSFARLGDEKWTWLPPQCYYHDCIYKDGLLYAVTSQGAIHAFNLRGPVVTTKLIIDMAKEYIFETTYIVQVPCGDLMQVWRSQEEVEDDKDFDHATYASNTGYIEIYKVDTTAEKLVGMNSLGDHVLFLGHNQSLCLSAAEYPQLKANHAYFTDDQEIYLFGYKNNRRDIGAFDLANSSSEELVSPQSPLEYLAQALNEDIQKMWCSVDKPEVYKEAVLSEFFNVGKLRQRFVHSFIPGSLTADRRGVIPASAFLYYCTEDLEVIWENKDLNLPAHKVMVATVRCEEILDKKLRHVLSDKLRRSMVASEDKLTDDTSSEYAASLLLVQFTLRAYELHPTQYQFQVYILVM